MNTRSMVVIGASAGGLGALKKLIRDLSADFSASIFIVERDMPDVCIDESVLLLNQLGDHFSQNGQANLAAMF